MLSREQKSHHHPYSDHNPDLNLICIGAQLFSQWRDFVLESQPQTPIKQFTFENVEFRQKNHQDGKIVQHNLVCQRQWEHCHDL